MNSLLDTSSMQHRVTFDQFDNALRHNDQAIDVAGSDNFGGNDIDGDMPHDWLIEALANVTPAFNTWLQSRGLHIDVAAQTIAYDVAQFDTIDAMCALVRDEYDDDCRPRGADSVWQRFDLAGDDDVDYNGSHVVAGIELLRLFEAWRRENC